ncbi:DUF4249 domain-containing protein [Pedobacter borealis]|uniref:DUF4249 domain-containing protein n=1 Tax=Pedobacter borealis TaxID=475254 RepID=UPI00068F4957|nr:DUF4249 domain-containing protein [Pedobacter borealis]
MKPIIYLIFMLLFLSSCDDVIELNLKDPQIKYVIEGMITNQPGICRVKISQTKDFNENNQFNGVSGALVQVEGNGVTVTLSENTTGIYQTDKINGAPGVTYRLTVKINNEVFTASSTMPDPVPLLDFTLKPGDYEPTRATPKIKFKDVATATNYYWFQQYINDVIQPQYKVFSDEFTSGQEINEYLVFENRTKDISKDMVRGDRLTVEMHSIEAPVYTYLSSLFNANGSADGAAPANPVSNINGGAIGFFSAHTVERKTIVIP